MDVTDVTALNVKCDYNPMNGLGDQTHLHAGLREAEKIAQKFLREEVLGEAIRSVVIIIMTDGLDMEEEKTRTYMAELRKKPYFDKIRVTACYFKGKDSTEKEIEHCMSYLKEFVSHPDDCREVFSAEELRDFFDASMVITKNDKNSII